VSLKARRKAFQEYNEDPGYLREQLLYRLTLAQQKLQESRLAKREVARLLATSQAQLYRLLDQTNYRKSVDRMLALLRVLHWDVDFVIRERGPHNRFKQTRSAMAEGGAALAAHPECWPGPDAGP
jgi:hypothetical protein